MRAAGTSIPGGNRRLRVSWKPAMRVLSVDALRIALQIGASGRLRFITSGCGGELIGLVRVLPGQIDVGAAEVAV